MTDSFYFGCWGEIGHYTYGTNGRTLRNDCEQDKWLRSKDGSLAPKGIGEKQGIAYLDHVEKWGGYTVLSFWDRSVDSRGNSSSTFLIPGTHDFDDAVEIAQIQFPEIWKRYPFEVKRGGV